jgi:hypothetical protein
MKEGEGLTWSQIAYWVICAALILGGAAMATWGHLLPWEWSRAIAKELGAGCLIAGILASVVEPHFRKEFARDAFLAAFRHVLPNEFRDEVEKIIRFDFIAKKQIWIVDIERVPGTDVVRVTTTFERTITNKTKSNKAVSTWYEAEDYKFPNGPTKIIECAIQSESQTEPNRFSAQIDHDHYVEAKTSDVTVKPDQTARLWGKAIQYRRTNDSMYETFRPPIVNPEIEVVINDEEFSHVVTFGTLGKVTKSEFKHHYTLSGVYFPGQFMFVRWWPKEPTTRAQ